MDNNNFAVINEIMSCKASSTIILTESNGEHVGFVADLANNYQKTFWLSIGHANIYSFAMTFAHKLLRDPSKLMKFLQFNQCESDYNKDIIIINAVLEQVASWNYDCLLVIDNLEKLYKSFDHKILETIIKNAPKNLKIVLISETFPDLNYNVFDTFAPKLITQDRLSVVPFDKNIASENFSEEDWEFLAKIASSREHVDKRIIERIYPERGIELVEYISRRYRSVIMAKGDELFHISTKLAGFLKEFKGIDCSQYTEWYDTFLYEYFCSLEARQYIMALVIAIDYGKEEWIDEAVSRIVNNSGMHCLLTEFLSRYDLSKKQYSNRYRYVRYLIIVSDLMNKRYDEALQKSRELIKEVEERSQLESRLIRAIAESMFFGGQKRECGEYAKSIISERVSKYGIEALEELVEIVKGLPDVIINGNLHIEVSTYKSYEKYLLEEQHKSKPWYYSMLQNCIRTNLGLGNYKRSIELLKQLKTDIPYYVVPHNIIAVYFFAGDMELAKKAANEIIVNSHINGVSSNITDAYVLLGLVSFYYNNYSDAQQMLDFAVKNFSTRKQGESSLFNAVSIRAVVYAEMGRAEYGKDIALLYEQRCEITGSKYAATMAGTAAYCYWVLRDKENALHYAKKCIANSSERAAFWLISTAIVINYLFEEDDDEFKTSRPLVAKFLNASKNYGMHMLFVMCSKCFLPLIECAEKFGIDPDYVCQVRNVIERKEIDAFMDSSVTVKFMGTTAVFVDKKEIIWKTRKAKELFLMYVLRGEEGIDRNEIINTFWSDYLYVSAINNLKTTNNIIRNTLSSRNIKFKLEYVNSKYTLKLANVNTDLESYDRLIRELYIEGDVYQKMRIMTKIITMYGIGFAPDIKVAYFDKKREKLRDDLGIEIIKLIREVANRGDAVAIKQYVSTLKKLHVSFDYVSLLADIDKRLVK